jgi:hypothetical protein
MDQRGRARRLVLALLVAAAAAAAAYAIADGLAKPNETRSHYQVVVPTGPDDFVWYMTGFFGVAAFILTLKIANRIAAKRWRAQLVAPARTVKPD